MIIFFHLALISGIAALLYGFIGLVPAYLIGISLSAALIVVSQTKLAAYRRNFSALYTGTPIYFVLALVCVHFIGAPGLLVLPIAMGIVFIKAELLLNGRTTPHTSGPILDNLDNPTSFVDSRGINLFDDDRI